MYGCVWIEEPCWWPWNDDRRLHASYCVRFLCLQDAVKESKQLELIIPVFETIPFSAVVYPILLFSLQTIILLPEPSRPKQYDFMLFIFHTVSHKKSKNVTFMCELDSTIRNSFQD